MSNATTLYTPAANKIVATLLVLCLTVMCGGLVVNNIMLRAEINKKDGEIQTLVAEVRILENTVDALEEKLANALIPEASVGEVVKHRIYEPVANTASGAVSWVKNIFHTEE